MTLRVHFFSIMNPIGQMVNFSVCNQTVIISIISLPKITIHHTPDVDNAQDGESGELRRGSYVLGGWYMSFVLAISIIFFWFIYSILAAYLLLLGAW